MPFSNSLSRRRVLAERARAAGQSKPHPSSGRVRVVKKSSPAQEKKKRAACLLLAGSSRWGPPPIAIGHLALGPRGALLSLAHLCPRVRRFFDFLSLYFLARCGLLLWHCSFLFNPFSVFVVHGLIRSASMQPVLVWVVAVGVLDPGVGTFGLPVDVLFSSGKPILVSNGQTRKAPTLIVY